jgi:hypothetical protein
MNKFMILHVDIKNRINFLRLFDKEKRIMFPNDDLMNGESYQEEEWESLLFYIKSNYNIIELTENTFKQILKIDINNFMFMNKNYFLRKHRLEEWII